MKDANNNIENIDSEELQLEKAKSYLTSTIEARRKEAFAILEDLADAGLTEALFIIGKLYYEGNVIKQDLDNAEDYLSEAKNNGHSEAKLLLGKIYATSTRPLKRRKVLPLFKEAAADGIPEAMYLYAIELLKQDKEDEEALELMHKAADKKHPSAQSFMGICEDMQGNYQEACCYYEKAAKQKDTVGLRLIADRYMYDETYLPKDKENTKDTTYEDHIYEIQRAAKAYYEESAKQGDLESEFRCAVLKRDGIYKDHAPNISEAIEALLLSAKHYYAPAIDCLGKIAESKFSKYLGPQPQGLIKWFEERQACAEADAAFGTEEAYAIYASLERDNGYAKYKKALCQYYGYGVKQNRKEAVHILKEDITFKPHTRYNALAHYLLSHYYLLENTDKQKEALKSHRKALNYKPITFRSEIDFHEALEHDFGTEELVYSQKIAELANQYDLEEDTEENIEINEAEMKSAKDRQAELIQYLKNLKSNRMTYKLIKQSIYTKYCNGSRNVPYDALPNIALDAALSVEECRYLYNLSGRTFQPLQFSDDHYLKLVLSGEYVNKLLPEELKIVKDYEKYMEIGDLKEDGDEAEAQQLADELIKELKATKIPLDPELVVTTLAEAKCELQAALMMVTLHFETARDKKKTRSINNGMSSVQL